MIKRLACYERCPIFFAPFYFSYQKRETLVTIIGLNIVFYFAVEIYFSIIDMARNCSRIAHNKGIDND